jgi:hypothetical protein
MPLPVCLVLEQVPQRQWSPHQQQPAHNLQRDGLHQLEGLLDIPPLTVTPYAILSSRQSSSYILSFLYTYVRSIR